MADSHHDHKLPPAPIANKCKKNKCASSSLPSVVICLWLILRAAPVAWMCAAALLFAMDPLLIDNFISCFLCLSRRHRTSLHTPSTVSGIVVLLNVTSDVPATFWLLLIVVVFCFWFWWNVFVSALIVFQDNFSHLLQIHLGTCMSALHRKWLQNQLFLFLVCFLWVNFIITLVQMCYSVMYCIWLKMRLQPRISYCTEVDLHVNVCRSFEVAHSRVGESPSSSDSESSSRSESDSESVAEGQPPNPGNISVKTEVNNMFTSFFSLAFQVLFFWLRLTTAPDFGKSLHTSANRNYNPELTTR